MVSRVVATTITAQTAWSGPGTMASAGPMGPNADPAISTRTRTTSASVAMLLPTVKATRWTPRTLSSSCWFALAAVVFDRSSSARVSARIFSRARAST